MSVCNQTDPNFIGQPLIIQARFIRPSIHFSSRRDFFRYNLIKVVHFLLSPIPLFRNRVHGELKILAGILGILVSVEFLDRTGFQFNSIVTVNP
jgi:hypothetical protein